MSAAPAYSCQLTEASQTKAKDELNEISGEHQKQLQQFIDWITQHNKWLTAPTDAVFLLSFLRVRKFSQLLARETLVNFIVTRQKEPQFFKNVDVDDPKTLAMLKSGVFIPLPRRDRHGRQVLMVRPAHIDISGKVYKIEDLFKSAFLMIDHFLRDEEMQVNGMVILLDYSKVTLKIESYAGDCRTKFIKILTKMYPIRMKGIIVYNGGTLMEFLMGILKSVLKEKLLKRIQICNDMVLVYEKLGKSVLPLDYLPDDYKGEHAGTCTEIMDNFITRLQAPDAREWATRLSSGEFKVDEKKMPPREELFQEAFRKLTVD